jgi:hypothetical protein
MTAYTGLDLLRMQIDALYTHDAKGRLLSINEHNAFDPAPRFFLGCTAHGNLWRIRYDIPADLAAELERLAAAEPLLADGEPPRYRDQYADLLKQHAPVSAIEAGPAYILPDLDPSTSAVIITPQNANVLEANYPYTLSTLKERSPVTVMVADGVAVAACYCARITSQVAEAGVHTEETHRGQGYAEEIVRAWTGAVRVSGRLPLYSTSWDNTASQRVAAKLGAVQYAEDFSIT